ncbi:MAG: trypsin-like peptidase domain-containing protein [Thiobacillus sp.]|nr:trypsin-like peptidase domain-containing protein [Thiobacillus sp.]
MNKHGIACGLAFAAALGNSSAFALVGGSLDANIDSSPWAGVGAITISGGVYSGVMLDSQHVLTAAHVVGGQVGTPGNVSFTLNVGGDLTHTYSASAISVYGGYTGMVVGADGVWHDDLAIVRLSAPVAGVIPAYDLYGGSLANQTLTLVGYGRGGDGISGATIGASASVKRVGQNRVDDLLVDDDGGAAKEVFIFDFDGPTSASNVYGPSSPTNLALDGEAQFASGDSGSPVFVDDNGVWKIAGIANFNSGVLFGTIGGGTIVAPYQSWIQATIAPVPEPHTWLMLLAGLGLVGAARYSRQRA